MKQYFSEQVRKLRGNKGISQEELAKKMGVSTQAVSKWECGLSYPDIELLPGLADALETTIDALLGHERSTVCLRNLPNTRDDKLYIVWARNGEVLTQKEYDPNIRIPLISSGLESEQSLNIDIWGSADIEGEINGNVNAGQYVECDNVGGNVNAGRYVECDSVGCNINAGQYVECDSVGGNVNAGQYVECDNIGGNVSGMEINCHDIQGETIHIKCSHKLNYDAIYGNVVIENDNRW